jgi:hypothetical protein
MFIEANMTKVGPKNATQRYEIPADWTIPDFLRRAVAEAKLVVAEIDKAQAEMDEPKTA